MNKRVVLAGYFGCGNLGDDAILLGFNDAIGSELEIKPLLGSPELMMRSCGVGGVNRKDMRAVKSALEQSDALVFPGGSIFQDVTSVRSVAYYANLVKMAKKAGKKVIMLGQGVGPLNTFAGKRMALGAFESADLIVVRDEESARELLKLGYKPRVEVSADMAFLMKSQERAEGEANFGAGGMKSIGIAPRSVGKERKAIVKLFGDAAKSLYQKGYVPVLISMDHETDRQLIVDISKTQGGKIPDLKEVDNPRTLKMRLSRLDAVIAVRLHAGILAVSAGVPTFLVDYDPKVAAFANSIGLSSPPKLQGLTATRLEDSFEAFMGGHQQLVESLPKKRDELARKASINIQLLRDALGG